MLADAATDRARARETNKNPAALLALAAPRDRRRGQKDMVVLPYKDRLLLFSRYLQQLVMESLGKRDDLKGEPRRPRDQRLRKQGLDQHAYVQQLRDGVNNFFVTFIRVLEDGGDSAWRWSRA